MPALIYQGCQITEHLQLLLAAQSIPEHRLGQQGLQACQHVQGLCECFKTVSPKAVPAGLQP
jgi:hypothetical protein